MWVATQGLGPIGSAVLTLIGYKQAKDIYKDEFINIS